MKISNYVEPELQMFRKLCNFTPQEMDYFNMKARDKTNVQIAIDLCISESSVSNLSKKVKSKMKRVEKSLQK